MWRPDKPVGPSPLNQALQNAVAPAFGLNHRLPHNSLLNSFLARNIKDVSPCKEDTVVPFMSG